MANATVRPMTTRTRVALGIARSFAAARGDRDLTPAHVALGILREGANPALAALYNRGVMPDALQALRAELEDTLGPPPGHTAPRQVAIDSTPGEEVIIQSGEKEAERLHDSYLGTEHLLLAILRDPGSDAATLLAGLGISAALLESGISSVRRGDLVQ